MIEDIQYWVLLIALTLILLSPLQILFTGAALQALLGDLPVIYPFIVNDPGEAAQARRVATAEAPAAAPDGARS